MNELKYHEGKPSFLMTAGRVVVLCPKGHLVEALPTAEWAHSGSEARYAAKTVRCCGAE